MEIDEKELEVLKRRALQQSRKISILLGVAIFLAVIFTIHGYMLGIEVEVACEIAKNKERAALIAETDALRQRDQSRLEIAQLRAELEKCQSRK